MDSSGWFAISRFRIVPAISEHHTYTAQGHWASLPALGLCLKKAFNHPDPLSLLNRCLRASGSSGTIPVTSRLVNQGAANMNRGLFRALFASSVLLLIAISGLSQVDVASAT